MATRHFGKTAKMTLGGAIILTAVAMAVLAPWIAPYDPYAQDLLARLKPPFWSAGNLPEHWLGTDNLGRDLVSRLIYGSRLSITVGVAAAVLSCALGSCAGLVAGYRGGRLEQVVMRLADAHLAFPEILL